MPPVNEGTDVGVLRTPLIEQATLVDWVDFRDRHLDITIFRIGGNLVEQIGFKPVCIKPILLHADGRIIQNGHPDGPKTLQGISDMSAEQNRQKQRVNLDHHEAEERRMIMATSRQITTTLHIVRPALGNRLQQSADLRRVVFIVSRQYYDSFIMVFRRVPEHIANGSTHADVISLAQDVVRCLFQDRIGTVRTAVHMKQDIVWVFKR